jgi:hypothetical protein
MIAATVIDVTSTVPRNPPSLLPSSRRDLRDACRSLGNAELLATIDALRCEAAELDAVGEDRAVAAILVGDRLEAARAEWSRRVRLHAAGEDVADPHARRYADWLDLARQVREQADIVAVFEDGGYHLDQTGRHEWHGACFACRAGHDRMMVRTDPPYGRYWCRGCDLGGDAIHAARSLFQLSFHGAVTRLARSIGLTVPDDRPTIEAAVRPDAAMGGVRREGVIRLA